MVWPVRRVMPSEVSTSSSRFLKFLLCFGIDRLQLEVLKIDEEEEQESHLRAHFRNMHQMDWSWA
jgi:hypothetical protein